MAKVIWPVLTAQKLLVLLISPLEGQTPREVSCTNLKVLIHGPRNLEDLISSQVLIPIRNHGYVQNALP